MTTSRLDGERGVSTIEHRFHPRGEWWSLCRVCGLAESAHVLPRSGRRCASCGTTLVDSEVTRCHGCETEAET